MTFKIWFEKVSWESLLIIVNKLFTRESMRETKILACKLKKWRSIWREGVVKLESILPNFFFLRFFFFGVKLGHFTINNFFLYVMKTQAYQGKTEKFFVSEEKKFGRIDSWFQKLFYWSSNIRRIQFEQISTLLCHNCHLNLIFLC